MAEDFKNSRFSSGISGARSLNKDIRIPGETNDSGINHSSLPLGRKQSSTSSSWGSLLKRAISVATAWQWPLTGPCLPSIGCATMALASYAAPSLEDAAPPDLAFFTCKESRFPRDYSLNLAMKMPLSHSGLILFIASAMAWASPPQSASRIMVSSESPALHVANARFNPHNNTVGGVVSLNFGYAAPWSPHVHIFALDSSGTLLYKSCDRLMRHLLARNPRLHRGRDSFSVSLPAKLHGIATIRVVASSGHAGCNLDNRRIFTICRFSRP